ncbi:hypothetical protein ABZX75_28695 [Streptomyces sp. NPDC003038]
MRIRAGRAGETLDHRDIVELHAALTAWLRLNKPPAAHLPQG